VIGLKKKRILIAVGNPHYSEILRKNLLENSNLFEVAPQEILHRRFLEEMVDIDKPDILIIHDYYLESDLQEPKEKEKEIIDVIKKLRVNYDDSLRVIYLCERQKGDPFLSALVGFGVLDIFNENSIDLEDLIEQVSEKPRFSKVEKFLHSFDSTTYKLDKEEIAEENEEVEVAVEDEEENVDQRPIIQNVIEKKIINKVVEKKIIQKNIIKRDYKIHIHNQVEKVIGVNIPRKLILVGSPFKRTGSTFFSLMLAKFVQEQGIGVTYLENPFQAAYCYDRFYGMKHASNYTSLYHAFTSKEQHTNLSSSLFTTLSDIDEVDVSHVWKHEDVRLMAINPTNEKRYTEEQIDLEVFIKILLSLQDTPYLILDIGTDWMKDIFQELFQLADDVYIVIEPDIPNIERLKLSKESYFNYLREIMEQNKTTVVGNQFTKQINRKVFENELFMIPSIPSDVIFHSQYEGTFLPLSREAKIQCEESFQVFIKQLIPLEYLKKKKDGKHLIRKLFNTKINLEK
jgi:hypothetical protein